MSAETPTLKINLEVLKELEQSALTIKVPSTLPYVQFQQAITIQSLITWMESYGLQAPFKLDL